MSFELDRGVWQQVAPYLDQALDLPAAERDAWLELLAGENPQIATALRGLLDGWRLVEANRFLDQPLSVVLTPPTERSGEQIGAYTIDSLIGRGGMSEVWLAHRHDGRFTGQVAIKFLQARTTTAGLADRFRREGKLLARLTHPHIARLIDAGVTSGGQPYLVLEYVEGETIEAYCNSHGFDVRARIRLFLNVLAAVAHAHGNLIVHRDIKPSNVLITRRGEVKLLDFGIAKFLTLDPANEDYSTPTQLEDVALTPEYAAPEQLLGEPQSAATDVYQLGVLLHVLLSGHLPFERTGTTRAARIKAALEVEPTRPSDVASASLRGDLRGDIDAIVGKALRRKPNERYNSAEAFSSDLQRFLNNETVGARDGALAYRVRKFFLRYRSTVLGSAAAALALIAVTVFAVLQMHDAQTQRDQARFQQKRAEAESRFMTLMMSTVGSDRPVTPAQILSNGMDLLERQYSDDPRFRTAMFIHMAARFMDLGDTEQQYSALLKAETLANQLHDPDSIATIECDAVEPEISLGHPDRAALRLAQGQRALATIADPTLYSRVECLDAEASLLEAQGNETAAISKAERAVGYLEQAAATNDVQYTDILSHVGQMYWDTGNIKKAFEVHQRNGAALERNGLEETESGLSVEHAMAAELMEFGEVRLALEREQVVVSRQRKAGSVIPAITTTYGLLQLRMAQPAAALDSFNASLAAASRAGDLPSELFARVGRARSLLAEGKLAEVDTELALVAQLARGRETAMRRPLVRARIAAAETLLARGRLPEARQEIETALGDLHKVAGSHDALYLGSAMLISSRIAAAEARYPDAEQTATNALHLFEQRARSPDMSADVGEALLVLAHERRAQGDSKGAADLARRAQSCLEAALGPEHPLTRNAALIL